MTASNNPLVAQYSVTVSGDATISVEYGPDTNYGMQTSAQSAPSGGGTVNILVAGMKASTQYHMRAVVNASSGVIDDSDHSFTTGAIPDQNKPSYTLTVGAGQTPSPGLRLVSGLSGTYALNSTGDVVWYYADPTSTPGAFYLTKTMDNGHLIELINYFTPPANSFLREMDLAGNTIRELSQATLQQKLTAAGHDITLVSMDHDVLVLPNGDWVFICSNSFQLDDGTQVQGNVLVEVDQNNNVVWFWDARDHLDINRRPMGWPDWTHANSLFYIPDDGSLLLSLRHQYWVLKIDFNTGSGSGNVIWKLGYQGDFTLQNSSSPADWFYAQHDANIVSSNLTGNFQLALWDNGNNRVLDDNGDTCNPTTGTPPCYSTSAIFDVDETNKTASRQWSYQTPFSFWGGSTQLLTNGNILFDETAPSDLNGGSRSIETTQDANPPIIWKLETTKSMYRVQLITSLYPGQ